MIGACGLVFSLLAAVVPLAEIVKLVNIGTLFAFIVVNVGVWILRHTQPGHGARLPGAARAAVPDHRDPAVRLPGDRSSRPRRGCDSSSGWRIGLVIYGVYGYRHSRLRKGEVVAPDAELPGAS